VLGAQPIDVDDVIADLDETGVERVSLLLIAPSRMPRYTAAAVDRRRARRDRCHLRENARG
jgi:hypothetical protein